MFFFSVSFSIDYHPTIKIVNLLEQCNLYVDLCLPIFAVHHCLTKLMVSNHLPHSTMTRLH